MRMVMGSRERRACPPQGLARFYMRATRIDSEMAQSFGVPVQRIYGATSVCTAD